jgi:mono/diheme cytochrome c family protein
MSCLAIGGPAAAEDLHRLWDQQCGGCHGHAGDFARASLRVVDDRLIGDKQGERLTSFLEKHNGGYAPEIIEAMTAMLKAQVETPDLFRTLCSECHGLAAQFARETLISRDGRLYGRYSGRDIGAYLRRHGGLDDAQASLMLGVLSRIEAEVHRP